jgi:hypothetical protein
MYGLSKATEVSAPGGTDTANVQADLARLKDEAFAPLANDLITVAARSPNGVTPEEALQGFAVGDSARDWTNAVGPFSTAGWTAQETETRWRLLIGIGSLSAVVLATRYSI